MRAASLHVYEKSGFDASTRHLRAIVVKLAGDGALIEFPSAVDALSAAIEFQQATTDANRGEPDDTAIIFRMGLHLGDVIIDGNDLYGDAVNVADRLEIGRAHV